jgi:hypothetical protein
MARKLVIFVHGWSVRKTDTYGEFPDRLQAEAEQRGDLDIDVRHIWLGKYISFRDEVRVEDISRAFEAALRREVGTELRSGRRFAAITHSTGGPVVRDWWHRHYVEAGRSAECPMSHLIMLAPANFGSTLAQLGKGTAGRLKSWFEGVEPGAGVLDWLELGSPEAWELNEAWIRSRPSWKTDPAVYPFVLTGQSIDRSLYDHVNSYTGESGSDGVVRVAAANLNAAYARLVQVPPELDAKGRNWIAPKLEVDVKRIAPRTACAVLPGRAHSGKTMGILRSVRTSGEHPTVAAVIRCLRVASSDDYETVRDEFDALTARTQTDERVEIARRFLLPDSHFVHDRYTQMIMRLTDSSGFALGDFDFLLTAGDNNSPDLLPQGFFVDRQRNRRHRGTVTYYLNHDVMQGSPAVTDDRGRILREASSGAQKLGFRVQPRPEGGFVHYLSADFSASAQALREFVRPNATLLLDVCLQRVVRQGAFTLTTDRKPSDFTKEPPGPPLPEAGS